MPVKAKDLKPNMMVDMEECVYVNDEGDMRVAEFTYAEVETVTQEAGDVTVVTFNNFTTYALPSDYEMVLCEEDEENLNPPSTQE